MPRPLGLSNPVSLCRGLIVVTVCLVVAASLLGSPFFAGSHWLDGTQFSPGLQTLSGPIDLSVRVQAPNPGEFPLFPTGFPTSHPPDSPPCPNQPSDSEFSCSGNLASHPRSDRVNHDSPWCTLMTTVLITSETDNAKLLFNVPLGHVRSVSAADFMVFWQAAEHTALLFAENWFSLFASSADSTDFRAQSEHKPCQQTRSVSVIHATPADTNKSTTSPVSFSAPNVTDFDSSLLSLYLEQCSFTEH